MADQLVAPIIDVEQLEVREREAFLALRERVRDDQALARIWDRWIAARRELANAQLELGRDLR